MGTEERRMRVLGAIVHEYVSAREPVGSRSLVERHHFGVSPATIRNDMAALEEAGLIQQPYTSAGRVPTDKGYRHFVDSIDQVKPLSGPERRAIEKLLSGAVDLDDILARAVRTLAQITRQAAVVQYPSLQRVSLRHIDLIPAGARHVILVIITQAGRVEKRTLEGTYDDLDSLVGRLNAQLVGLRGHAISEAIARVRSSVPASAHEVLDAVGVAIDEALEAEVEERVVTAGTAHLSRHSIDFSNSISPVLDVLEEQVVLLRLLAAMQDGVTVTIGEENHYEELSEASVVSSSYEASDHSVARVGIVGPTRMDYPGAMAAVHAISRYLSEILSNH
ncbi:MAG: heat-inducible transcriptional repressor HrcA [Actinomycetaceae bacterium]|nr:heat-inducible transcriptional repressor HrcA [Actinomycetaceae bacterium]